MLTPIVMEERATIANFNEDAYLAFNPDVVASVRVGQFVSGRDHFMQHGMHENRRQRHNGDRLTEARRAKMEKIRPFLRSDLDFQRRGDKLDYLSNALRKATRIVVTDNISANGYDAETLSLIEQHDLVLDCGCGRRPEYFANVINYEIVDYDTTDIIGVGEKLPFKDNTFDAVISIAVLEHVRDPFLCAKEISRVLKPGGQLFCSVPFLQPYHGYPHHYFNTTHQGIKRLFEDDLTIRDVTVSGAGHPAFALHWFLRSWVEGLPSDTREEFKNLRIGDILADAPDVFLNQPIGELHPDAMKELACSFVLKADKPTFLNKAISGVLRGR